MDAIIVLETIIRFCKDAAVSGRKKNALYFSSSRTLKFTVNFFSTLIQVGSVEPARDFCFLVKRKSIPFGEGEVLLRAHVCFVEFYKSPAQHLLFSIVLVVVTLLSSSVCQQLIQRIEQLLSNRNTPYYMKSITGIQAFREQSVKVSYSFMLPSGPCMPV